MKASQVKWFIVSFVFIHTISGKIYAQGSGKTTAIHNQLSSADAFEQPVSTITKSPYNLQQLNSVSIYVKELLQNADKRAMKDIKGIDYGVDEIMLLQPVTYNWKTEPDTNTQIGLIAQDVQKVIPEVVTGKESEEILGINYNAIIPVLMNALKEQQKEIARLTNSIHETKNEIKLLKEQAVN